MKLIYTVILAACSTSIYAAELPTLDTSSTYRKTVAPKTATKPPVSAAKSSASLASKVGKLQVEVAQLKSSLSTFTKKQNTINASFDKRLDALGATASIPSVLPTAAAVIDSAASPATESHAASGDEKNHYNVAYATFKKRDYSQAITLFKAQVAAYPDGEYADNAYYWMGEAYLRKGNKATALQMFNKVVSEFPHAGKAPDALLKLGITQLSLGKKANAKDYFDYLISTHPDSSSAHIAITKKAQAGL
jgi:tol-pal system protein YbgF